MAQQYTIKGNLRHDQTDYQLGDTITLEDNQAAPLVAIGRIELTEAKQSDAVPVEPSLPLPDGLPSHEMTAPQQGEPMTAMPKEVAEPALQSEQVVHTDGALLASDNLTPQQPAQEGTAPAAEAK